MATIIPFPDYRADTVKGEREFYQIDSTKFLKSIREISMSKEPNDLEKKKKENYNLKYI